MDFTRRSAIIGGTLLSMGSGVAFARGAVSPAPTRIGVQTYSFRDMLPLPGDMVDKMIDGCRRLGVDMLELFEPTIQPPAFSENAPWAVKDGKLTQASLYGRPPEGPPPANVLETRQRIREWRLSTPLSHFREIGRRFARAGIEVQAFNFGLKEDCTDAEVEWGFAVTKALRARAMTASTTLRMAARSAPFAARHRTIVGLHGHSNLRDPNQLATPESFEQALKMSPWYRLNFDIGHFAAGGFDTLGFLHRHHKKIISVHLKDRKAHDGMNMPFGEGDTPVCNVVRTITGNRWPIPMLVEYEYAGGASVPELARIIQYVRTCAAKA